MIEHDRGLAEAIHHAIISPDSVDAAERLWHETIVQHPEWTDRKCMWWVLARTSQAAIDDVLARRQCEAARTGPWDVL